MIKKCFAKINLSLDIISKRPDGYHNIDTLMARINLFDKLEIEKNSDGKFTYESNLNLGKVEDNLVFKAYEIMKNLAGDKATGIRVKLSKNIPVAAGLAGGSTNAAETMKALNELWGLGLSKKALMEEGAKLGADIPFFFLDRAARATGIGEILEPFRIKTPLKVLLVNDGTNIASAHVYKNTKLFGHINNIEIAKGLEEGSWAVVNDFENVMEDVVLRDFPHLKAIKENLIDKGAIKAIVSGSGGSIFGIFRDEKNLDSAYDALKDSYYFVRKVDLIDD
ncbi:4-(cytidine 5'-diphospho)-2-C-methyl-D-erythritol kinase [uncultured Anaerococcus sp.]|uniref:4-(cytidine 5'-diphospho)-2-C-methyl-D-erythritol kinase n=1 Tax=uncultured Anaerococcus sp. TaxID=293428 RepID=UPI002626D794|nr:4-(cytidine 5'-diphospho)-2-C-methyl-D-erythritol kinase [uncultured Anaerococcus sp.]